jgi:hypothetical protein
MITTGLDLDLLARVLAIRHEMRLRGEEVKYKIAPSIAYTVKPKVK